jgi:hypothetical protein
VGGSQLVLGILQLIIAFRYSIFVPLMYVLLIIEILLRMLVGAIKAVAFDHVPPGAVGNYLFLVISVLMLVLLWVRPSQDAGA